MLDTLNPAIGNGAVFHTATQLVDRHGDDAPREALRRAAERAMAGDGQSAAAFLHVASACRDLLMTERGGLPLN